MQPRILLRLIAMPALASSMLAIALLPAIASEVRSDSGRDKASDVASCDVPKAMQHKPAELNSSLKEEIGSAAIDIPVEHPPLAFSAAESDAAVALFGCDCPACLNMLQQLRTQPLLSNSRGHCLTAMQQRVSPQGMRDVLQMLDAEGVN